MRPKATMKPELNPPGRRAELQSKEVKALQSELLRFYQEIRHMAYAFPGLDLTASFLQSENELHDHINSIHAPICLREICPEDYPKYCTEEQVTEEYQRFDYVTTTLESFTKAYKDGLLQLRTDPVELFNMRSRNASLRQELCELKLKNVSVVSELETAKKKSLSQSESLREHRQAYADVVASAKKKGEAEFQDFQNKISKVSQENESMRAQLEVKRIEQIEKGLKIKTLQGEVNNTVKMQASDIERLEAEAKVAKTALASQNARIKTSDETKSRVLGKYFALKASHASHVHENRKKVESLQNSLNNSEDTAKMILSENDDLHKSLEDLQGSIASFAGLHGFIRADDSQSFNLARARRNNVSENESSASGLPSDLTPRALFGFPHNSQVNDDINRAEGPREFLHSPQRNISSSDSSPNGFNDGMESWGSGDFQNRDMAEAGSPRARAQSMSFNRSNRSNDWIRPNLPLRQGSNENDTPQGFYRVNAHFKRYPRSLRRT
ncbi:hypothetical protein JHW43_002947 [Diplocarpon mali]|nr:hypothetical protein JHW43_002947 [Diplocarpon mali]